MRINNRLRSVASLVDDNTSIIDVGCDHALLSIYLYLNRESVSVIASDVNSGPLEKAKENIDNYNLNDKIKIIQNDGIKGIDGFDTVIISGMGGLTIIDILNNGNLDSVKNIIVSPNNYDYLVREKIIKKGYYIDKELFIKDKGKFYNIISFKKGKRKYKKNDLCYPKELYDNKTYIEYLNIVLNKKKEVLNNLPKNKFYLKFKLRNEIKKLTNIIVSNT